MQRRLLTSFIAATLTLCRTDLRAEPQQGGEVTTLIKEAYTAANALLSAPQICRESGVEFLVTPAESSKLATCKEIAAAFVKSLNATARIAADEANGSIAPAIFAMLLQSHRSATWGLGPLVERNDIEGGGFFVPESRTGHGHSSNDPAFLFNILEKKLKDTAPSIAGVSSPAFEGGSTDRSLADSATLTQIENLWAKADTAVTWLSALSPKGSDTSPSVVQRRIFSQCAALVSLNAAITAWNRAAKSAAAAQRALLVSELHSKRADSVEAKLRESLAQWVRVAAIHNTGDSDKTKSVETWTIEQAWALHIAPTNLVVDPALSLEMIREKASRAHAKQIADDAEAHRSVSEKANRDHTLSVVLYSALVSLIGPCLLFWVQRRNAKAAEAKNQIDFERLTEDKLKIAKEKEKIGLDIDKLNLELSELRANVRPRVGPSDPAQSPTSGATEPCDSSTDAVNHDVSPSRSPAK